MKSLAKIFFYFSVGLGLVVFADSAVALKIASIADNVDTTVMSLAKMLQAIALISGIGFIMAAFFKFHQHKLNPTQVPLSQGLTLLVIGAGLTLFPMLIPTIGSAITGTTGDVAKVGGNPLTKT